MTVNLIFQMSLSLNIGNLGGYFNSYATQWSVAAVKMIFAFVLFFLIISNILWLSKEIAIKSNLEDSK